MDVGTAAPSPDRTPLSPEEKNAVFARVWSRVMEGREDTVLSPCAPLPPQTTQTVPAAQTSQTPQTPPAPDSENTPPPVCEVPVALTAERPHTPGGIPDFPTGQGIFLGEASRESVPLLQDLVRRALRDSREYQLLARRIGGTQAKVFQSLASEKTHHAKALCAACFLISGVRYWPEPGKAAPPASYLGALRRRFHLEQETMAAYLAAVEETADPCLCALFRDCAKAAWDSACRLRTLVEQV